MPSNESRDCPLCHRDRRHTIRIASGDWHLVKCAYCGFVYLANPPSYAALVDEFAWEKTFAEETERRSGSRLLPRSVHGLARAARTVLKGKRRSQELRHIRRFFRAGPVLDVGCGSGKLLRLMPPQFTPYGVEISQTLADDCDRTCRQRSGHVVHADAIEGMKTFPDRYFSGVMMRAYLEHEVNPAQALAQARRVLQPGGTLLIQVPNYGSFNRMVTGRRWCGYRYPDHVNYFTPQSLQRFVVAAGLRVKRFNLFDRFPLSDIMWLAAESSASSLGRAIGPLPVVKGELLPAALH